MSLPWNFTLYGKGEGIFQMRFRSKISWVLVKSKRRLFWVDLIESSTSFERELCLSQVTGSWVSCWLWQNKRPRYEMASEERNCERLAPRNQARHQVTASEKTGTLSLTTGTEFCPPPCEFGKGCWAPERNAAQPTPGLQPCETLSRGPR